MEISLKPLSRFRGPLLTIMISTAVNPASVCPILLTGKSNGSANESPTLRGSDKCNLVNEMTWSSGPPSVVVRVRIRLHPYSSAIEGFLSLLSSMKRAL